MWMNGELVSIPKIRRYGWMGSWWMQKRQAPITAKTSLISTVEYGKQISLNDLYSIMPHRFYVTGFNDTAKIEEGRIIRMKDSESKKL